MHVIENSLLFAESNRTVTVASVLHVNSLAKPFFWIAAFVTTSAAMSSNSEIIELISRTLNGLQRSDPEAVDAVNAADHLANRINNQHAEVKCSFLELENRVSALDPDWIPMDFVQRVMPITETVPLVVSPWQLGYDQANAIRWTVNNLRVGEVFVEMLKQPYDSLSNPMQVIFPRGVALGSIIPDFDLVYIVGFAKAVAILCILTTVVDLNMTDAQMMFILP